MGTQVSAWVDDEVYDTILEREERTGESKSKIASEFIQKGAFPDRHFPDRFQDTTDEGTESWFWPNVGQSLFLAGFIVALLAPTFTVSGIGMSLFGLGLMLWVQIQEHMQAGASLGEGIKTTLGLL